MMKSSLNHSTSESTSVIKYDNKYLHEGNETFVLMDKQVLFIDRVEIFTSLHENA